ncbi:type I site-specific restriction-modification system, restriction subunit [Actinobacillus pleuropneumoniae]|nr:type I site-specific restriction-modification system, restriction subunit [Actinobacillus pleuropneumoniae]
MPNICEMHCRMLRSSVFTGTPISLEDKDTQAVFGRYVSIYDIQDAVEDGATVPIVYEARQIPINESPRFPNCGARSGTIYFRTMNRVIVSVCVKS